MKKFWRGLAIGTALCSILTTVDVFAGETNLIKQEPQSTLLDVKKMTISDESIAFLRYDYTRDAKILFDSQELLPKTPVITENKIEGKTWYPHAKSEYGGANMHIDLGAYYMISDIGYMDANGTPIVEVWQGDPSSWEFLGSLATNYYMKYRIAHFQTPKPTRYLRITCNSTDSGINELGIYGYKVSELTDEDLQKTGSEKEVFQSSNLTSGQKIGANAFCDDPYPALSALGNIREYYNWSWMTHQDGTHSFTNVVDKDSYYQTLKGMGIDVIPCLQMTSEAFQDKGEEWKTIKNTIPVNKNEDTTSPSSYALHSNAMYNFAARYGNNPNIDLSSLNVNKQETVKVGLNTLSAVESWNEQDKTWETKDSYFTPYEYAAMLSGDYDGHEGTIINGGVKTADPDFKLAMGGLASSGENAVSYLTLMKEWFDFHRKDGKFAADIINYHDYITDEEAPENSKFRDNIRTIVDWRNENTPGLDIWCSEFDVLTKDLVQEGVDNHDNQAYAKGRADRLLRAFLVGEREGLDRLSMFMLRDEWSGVYANSGLTTGKGDWDKKESWYYVSMASDTLKNADLVDFYEADDIYIYKYKDRNTSEVIYALWSPTTDNSEIKDYPLMVGDCQKASLVRPQYGFKEGKKSSTTIENGVVTVDVLETVTFVKVSGEDVEAEFYPQEKIAIQELRLGDLNGSRETITFDNTEVVKISAGETPSQDNYMLNQFYHLFDESNTAPITPWLKFKNKPESIFKKVAVSSDQIYPYDAVVTFDDYYDITYVGIYDTYSTGKMDIYDYDSGKLIYTTNLDAFNCWQVMPVTNEKVSTNKIRIVKYNTAELTEMVFYGRPSNSRVGKDVEPVEGEIGASKLEKGTKVPVSDIDLGQLSLAAPKNHLGIQEAFTNLFDESDKTPKDTLTSLKKGTTFKTGFSNIWNSYTVFPYDAILKFADRPLLKTVGIYLGYGENSGRIELYNDETGELLLDQELVGNGKWIFLDLKVVIQTNAIRIVKYNARTIGEMQFYGN